MVDGSNAPQANEVAAAVEASPLPWSSARDSPEKNKSKSKIYVSPTTMIYN